MLHKQRPNGPVIHPIMTRNTQILNFFTENRAVQFLLIQRRGDHFVHGYAVNIVTPSAFE